MKILCTICARGGSSNLKNKNTKIINRNPLIAYTINIALKSKIFEDIIISSDSKKIINIAKINNTKITLIGKSIKKSGLFFDSKESLNIPREFDHFS